VQERIRRLFLEVHHDQRTREQRQAHEEMIASIAPRKSGTEVVRERIQEAFQQVRVDLQSMEEQQREMETVALIDENATSIPNGTTEQR
jgi:vacuolar-type H+-ATPase subunit E/Vma4